ncbi:LysR family transcriptional regulator [Variovorax sp. GT1P44]|uniref:LysR family transcriptional regulator n=1 Tax=Variovorax sp. GT1P44 TaxID=3443742 RepID=UPI003F48C687
MDQLLAMRVFSRIAEAGSFVKAADSLNMPKPTATKLLQALEAHLGVKLLQRTTRKLSLTPEGASYYKNAVRLIAEVEDMNAAIAGAVTRPSGRLRVEIGSSLANLVLIPALPDFRRRYPDIQLELGVSDRAADLVGEGVDCVIRGGVLADSTLVARRIADLDYLTVASPSYLKRFGAPIHPNELRPSHQILSYLSAQTGRPFALYFSRGDEEIEIVGKSPVSVSESTAHMTALLHGLGIGQTFKFMARPHVATGALTAVLNEWTRAKHPLHLVYPTHRHLNARLLAFGDWAGELFAKLNADADRRDATIDEYKAPIVRRKK